MANFGDPRLPERFWVKVDRSGECWSWTGSVDRADYGFFRWEGRTQRAYRVAYTVLVGPIPAGLQIDHLCRRPRCVNPDHLEPVTSHENNARSTAWDASRNKDTCRNGLHPWPEAAYAVADELRCHPCALATQRRNRRERHQRACSRPDCATCYPPTDADIDAALADSLDRLHRKD